MKVLITGGNGFVGDAIIKCLIENKIDIWLLLNKNSAWNGDEHLKSKIVRADVRYEILTNNFPINLQFDAVIHSAGLAHQFGRRDEKDFWDVNVKGTENVLNLAAKLSVKQFILISSVAVYGNSVQKNANENGLDETAECSPEGVYAVTKFEAEKIAQSVCQKNNLNLTVLRLATVIGENDRGNVSRLIQSIEKKRFLWLGKGENRKSLIYKGDVARACLEVLENPEKSEIYNLSADFVTMNEIVSEIYNALNRKSPKFYIPAKFLSKSLQTVHRISKIERLGKISKTVAKWLSDEMFSGEKFQKRFNFRLSVSIGEAIRREVESYLQTK